VLIGFLYFLFVFIFLCNAYGKRDIAVMLVFFFLSYLRSRAGFSGATGGRLV